MQRMLKGIPGSPTQTEPKRMHSILKQAREIHKAHRNGFLSAEEAARMLKDLKAGKKSENFVSAEPSAA